MVDLSEPVKAYKNGLKDKFNTEVEKYWNELVKESKTDKMANEATCKDYYKTVSDKKAATKSLNSTKGLRTFFMFIGFIMLAIGAGMTYYGATEETLNIKFIVIGIVLIVLGLAIAILAYKLPKNKIKLLDKKINELSGTEQSLLDTAYAQMNSLNNLYDWNIPCKIFNRLKTVVDLDSHFDVKKYQYLHDKYGFAENFDDKTSTLCVQSGSILGNPFLIAKTMEQYWYTKRYENSITIHWTTQVKTKDGWTTQHHSQTLTAYIDKPAAGYYDYTTLIYGNDAAPNLSFSRAPSGIDGKDEKQISRMIRKESKQFDKKAREAILDNDPNTNYVRFGNEEFESLFGGENRDNEVEFRLLFTPLAQTNLIKLIRSKDGFGDDWYFTKDHKLNFIQSRHSQAFDYSANPEQFIHFDLEAAHKRFVDYNNNFFKNFYYDLAPLISIPLYQQTKTKEYIYKKSFKGNVTYYEDEMMANSFNQSLFAHEDSNTNNILKASLKKTVNGTDEVTITAHGFRMEEHVTVFSQWGGDGHMHDIPVTWYEYVPVEKETAMAIEPQKSSRQEFNEKISSPEFKAKMAFAAAGTCLYQRGLFAALLVNTLTEANASNMRSALSNNVSNNSNINNNSNTASSALNNIMGELNEAVNEAKSRVKTNISNGNPNDGNSNNSNNQ